MIERRLKTKLLTVENRERLEAELEEVKEVLKRNEERLLSLRKEKTRSFIVAAALIFACFLIYGIFLMFFLEYDKVSKVLVDTEQNVKT